MGRSRSRRGIYAAIAAIVLTAGVAITGVAGADGTANEDVYTGGTAPATVCFSEAPVTGECTAGETAEVTINTGETVTFHFQGGQPHNAASPPGSTPAWAAPDSGYPTTGVATETFYDPGTYPFRCDIHPNMTGTITVEGEPVEPPPPPDPPPPPPPPPSSPPPPTTTPNPSGGTDTVKPRVSSMRPTALRRAVRVRFTLSEPATVTVRVKRGRTVIKSTRVQAPAGTRSVTLRSKKLKAGRYTVEIQARDAFGNRSSLARKRLSLRR